MSALARYLLPSEICVAIVRRHWAVLIPQVSIVAVTWIAWAIVLDASATAFVQTIAAFFFLFSAAWIGWLFGEWYIEQFVVTDKRVLLITGLIYRKLAVMPLAKVTDLTYERSPLGRVLGYGTFIMESAGQDQALSRVDFLRSPDQLYQRLSEELFGPYARGDWEDPRRSRYDQVRPAGTAESPRRPTPSGAPEHPDPDPSRTGAPGDPAAPPADRTTRLPRPF